MKIRLSLAFVSLALGGHPAQAGLVTHQKAGVRFEVPSGWKATPDGEELVVETTDESLLLVFWTPADTSWSAAVDGFRDEVDRMVNKVSVAADPRSGQLNGMPTVELEGGGEVDDAPVEWSATLMMASRPLIVLAFGPPGTWEQNLAKIEGLVSSIKKIK